MFVATDTRTRLLEASAELFRRHGYAGTGVKAILTAADAPYGSLYHFFPGGKEELGVAALDAGGSFFRLLVESIYPEGCDVVEATRSFFEGAAAVVLMTDYADACPVATVALEVANTSEPMRAAAGHAFDSWVVAPRQRFREAGIASVRADELATELLCLVEGAFLLARTKRSTDPIAIAGRSAVAAVERAVNEGLGAKPPKKRATKRRPTR